MTFLNVIFALFLFMGLLITMPMAHAASLTDSLWQQQTYEKRVYHIGQTLLEKNDLNLSIGFYIDPNEQTQARPYGAKVTRSAIIIDNKVLNYIETDDELAGIIAHELAHWLLENGKGTHYFLPIGDLSYYLVSGAIYETVMTGANKSWDLIQKQKHQPYSQTKEIKADQKAVLLMENAGYDPKYLHSILKKLISDEPLLWKTHPVKTQRLAKLQAYLAQREIRLTNSVPVTHKAAKGR